MWTCLCANLETANTEAEVIIKFGTRIVNPGSDLVAPSLRSSSPHTTITNSDRCVQHYLPFPSQRTRKNAKLRTLKCLRKSSKRASQNQTCKCACKKTIRTPS
ncbi:hypothetical protein Tcan_00643, partial [Toxocara canis]